MKTKLKNFGKNGSHSFRLFSLICTAFFLLTTACTSTVYVPVQSHTASSSDREHITARVDTVLDRDTVTLTLTVKGDTVRQDVTRWRTRIKAETCTLSVCQTDTIFREIPVGPQGAGSTSVPWYYRILSAIGTIALFVAAVCLLAFGIARLAKR